VRLTAGEFWNYSLVHSLTLPLAKRGVEPFATWLNLPKDTLIPRYPTPKGINIIVVGGQTNAFWQAGDFKYQGSAVVDQWKWKYTSIRKAQINPHFLFLSRITIQTAIGCPIPLWQGTWCFVLYNIFNQRYIPCQMFFHLLPWYRLAWISFKPVRTCSFHTGNTAGIMTCRRDMTFQPAPRLWPLNTGPHVCPRAAMGISIAGIPTIFRTRTCQVKIPVIAARPVSVRFPTGTGAKTGAMTPGHHYTPRK